MKTEFWPLKLGPVLALTVLAFVAAPVSAPVADAQSTGYTQVSAGGLHTCALTTSGVIECWGYNFYGQTDSGPYRACPWSGTEGYVEVSAGGYHTLGRTCDDEAIGWGKNWKGQAGYVYGTKQISAGGHHSCAILGYPWSSIIKCWGAYEEGQCWVDPSYPWSWSQVSAGEAHTCGIAIDLAPGEVYCWGANDYGQVSAPAGVFKQISAGGSHTCGVLSAPGSSDDGKVKCWGAGTKKTGVVPQYGQSMPPDGTFIQVSAGQYHTCGIRTDNTLVCWGYNLYGQVGKVPDGKFKQVDAGYGHACAITTDNRLYCWGRNDYGQASVPMPAAPGGGYDFEGFYPPVGSPPVLNEIEAGSAVPLKFGLGGDKGLDVMESGYPRSAELDCTELEPVGDVQATSAAGKSALAYDPATERYSYVWKTNKAWGGTCRVLVVRLSDGSQHFAAFRFK